MAKKSTDKMKLGMFVIAGGIFLVVLLYMIGTKENLFSRTFLLKARFSNAQGLTRGNNVRLSGIQIGTVRSVKIINDSTVEVVMRIEESMRSNIKTNAVASIGTEGFIGNKLVNIFPGKEPALPVSENDIITDRKTIDTDDMLQTLNATNKDINIAAADLKAVIQKFNNSTALWKLLNDESIPANLRIAVQNVKAATSQAQQMTTTLNLIVGDIKSGKGSLGALVSDTGISYEIQETLEKIKSIGSTAEKLAAGIQNSIDKIDEQISNGKGTIPALLNDSSIVTTINASLKNIENGTAAFNQNMEALKHNILFRGYFKKLEREQNKNRK